MWTLFNKARTVPAVYHRVAGAPLGSIKRPVSVTRTLQFRPTVGDRVALGAIPRRERQPTILNTRVRVCVRFIITHRMPLKRYQSLVRICLFVFGRK